jgi:phosphatidylserine/phosphatidylglycerophosphate/cardiolipin synthase-like enzyme
LRDSNPIYSAFWRLMVAPWGEVTPSCALPNPFGREGCVPVRSYLDMLNFKANHRKIAILDQGDGYVGFVTSANPHDGSSAHSNVALRFSGPAVADLLETARAVLAMSGGPEPGIRIQTETAREGLNAATDQVRHGAIRVITEGAIRDLLLTEIGKAGFGDRIDVAAFYLAHRRVVHGLIEAHARGAWVRVLLDPSKDAFGMEKNGIPNRQSGAELHRAGVPVRWCDTHGEQCHSKLMLFRYAGGRTGLMLGSANLTRRNLDSFNLETNLYFEANTEHPVNLEVADWFDMLWHNAPGKRFSLDYSAHADENGWRRLLYRIMEGAGLSTF